MDRSNNQPDNGFQEVTDFIWLPLGGGYRCCGCLKEAGPPGGYYADNGLKHVRVKGCIDERYHTMMPNTVNCAFCLKCAKRMGLIW